METAGQSQRNVVPTAWTALSRSVFAVTHAVISSPADRSRQRATAHWSLVTGRPAPQPFAQRSQWCTAVRVAGSFTRCHPPRPSPGLDLRGDSGDSQPVLNFHGASVPCPHAGCVRQILRSAANCRASAVAACGMGRTIDNAADTQIEWPALRRSRVERPADAPVRQATTPIAPDRTPPLPARNAQIWRSRHAGQMCSRLAITSLAYDLTMLLGPSGWGQSNA